MFWAGIPLLVDDGDVAYHLSLIARLLLDSELAVVLGVRVHAMVAVLSGNGGVGNVGTGGRGLHWCWGS
jgi:hypothetical protein